INPKFYVPHSCENCCIYPLRLEDEPFLWEMLFEAAHLAEEGETSVQAAMKHPQIAKYVRDWGKATDIGFGAIDRTTHQKIGAAWLRLFPETDRGYGYIDDRTPELSIAVLPAYRGQGVGTRLLVRLLDAAKTLYPAVSLSVRRDNPAMRLYRRMGFQVVEGCDSLRL
ncbi:MAG: N-acetyltransferase, partial [Geitlerinemataceae cyanobacterium]